MKLKNKLLLTILLLVIIPINVFAYSNYVIASGETIGIEVNSKGILVVGFYEVEGEYSAKEAGFEIGDKIIKVDNTAVNSIEDMITVIEKKNTEKINFTIKRGSQEKKIALSMKKDKNDILKTGLYVKDQINGIGTLTYIDPKSRRFGALGHEIIETTTAQKFEIKDGKIFNATVSKIEKSRNGEAGEKNATYDKITENGKIDNNDITGIYGTYQKEINNMENHGSRRNKRHQTRSSKN